MIRVLVVDDSEVSRRLLTHILNSDPGFQVVGTASNGVEAIGLAEKLRPDVVTMDVVMPVMDGYEATRRIMETTPLPIVIVSASTSTEEVGRTFKALEAGALALAAKPSGPDHPRYAENVQQLLLNVRLMSEIKVVRRRIPFARQAAPPEPGQGRAIRAAAMGASTGGPQALVFILESLPRNFSLPVLIVQHIADGFARGLVDWLAGTTALRVCLASPGESLQPGCCYVAPTGFHLGVDAAERISFDSGPPINGMKPSIDHLFRSAAQVFGPAAVGILLTGMGSDGAEGLKAMRDRQALTIAQDEASAVIASMPREAVRRGAASCVLSLEQIADKLVELSRANLAAGPGQ